MSTHEVFISYEKRDELYRKQLEKHLSALKEQGLISLWHDGQIQLGRDTAETVDAYLAKARIILLLVSADFLASDSCTHQMKQALKRHQAGTARVIPIVLRPCDWRELPIGKLQALPVDGNPVSLWADVDEAWAQVAVDLRRMIEDVLQASASAPSPTLPPIWNIPYPRNPFFTGRDELLTRLSAVLKADQATALSQVQAISGLGGIGKTQIAVEFVYQHRHEYQAVFWVLSDTRESLVSGFIAIAELLNLPQKNEQDQTIIIQAVKIWFQTHSSWLLILDNADDLILVREFVPPVFGGHILLTTRAQATGILAHRIEVDIMTSEAGALFLLRRAKLVASEALLKDALLTDEVIARRICEELGGLPLALDQAGAFIEETQCSLLDYQQRYRMRRTLLLKRRGELVKDHPEPVATTWSLSFEKVEQRSPIAADLLRLCALLHPDAIPVELIIAGVTHLGPSLASVAEDNVVLDEAVATLGAYSLISRNVKENTLSIHQLVQAVLKDNMDEVMNRDWAQRAVLAMNKAFPEVKFVTWPQCERYLSHALACTVLIEYGNIHLPEAASLLNRVGSYLDDRGRYGEAEPLLVQALRIREQQLGPEHPDTAASLDNLGSLYDAQGKCSEAEPLLVRALRIREQQLGPEHPDTAISLSSLASFYLYQRKYSDAEPLLVRALRIREQQLGPEHPDTAMSLNNLAFFYLNERKYRQAESLLMQALRIREQQLGEMHPGTAASLNNLAFLYLNERKYVQAEPLFVQALSVREQQLGETHPDTVQSLNNLARLYQDQGKYVQAETLYRRALAIKQRQLGQKRPDVAQSLNNLANFYCDQGKYVQAEPLYDCALKIIEQQWGRDHPDTAVLLNNLGSLYDAQGKYKRAETLLVRALSIRKQQLGPKHLDTAQSLNNLARLYRDQGKYVQAETLYRRALAIKQRQLGQRHPDVAQSLNNLVSFYCNQGKYVQAELLCKRVLTINERQLGRDHPDTASSLDNLGILYHNQGNYAKAESLYVHALGIKERQLGIEHPDTITSFNNLALLYDSQGKYSDAESLYRRALLIREQHLGVEHPYTADSLHRLADLYQRQGKYDQAESLYQRALAIRRQCLGPTHPETQETREAYAALLRVLGRDEEADEMEQNGCEEPR